MSGSEAWYLRAVAERAALTAFLSPVPASAAPLLIAIESHVENGAFPIDANQANMVERLANAAAAAGTFGVPLSFGIGKHTLRSYAGMGLLVQHVRNAGHAVTLHADLEDGRYTDMREELHDLAQRLRLLRGNPTVASGVRGACRPAFSKDGTCPQQFGWVEASRAAGTRTVAGVVRYCYLSLDPRTDEYNLTKADSACDPEQDGEPGTCHEPVPDDPADRLKPWRTRRTRTWLSSDPFGTLIVPTFPDVPFPCLSESTLGVTDPATCVMDDDDELAAAADAAALTALIKDAVDSRAGTAGETFHITWSTNWVPDEITSSISSQSSWTPSTRAGSSAGLRATSSSSPCLVWLAKTERQATGPLFLRRWLPPHSAPLRATAGPGWETHSDGRTGPPETGRLRHRAAGHGW